MMEMEKVGYTMRGIFGTEADRNRTRFLPERDLLIMGALHHDHAAHHSTVHQLHASAEEG